jgi:hypothetical protein
LKFLHFNEKFDWNLQYLETTTTIKLMYIFNYLIIFNNLNILKESRVKL